MTVLGIRCSNKDFTYVVLEGSKDTPKLTCLESVQYPTNYSRSRCLFWLVQEVKALISRYGVERIVMKGFEGRTRDKTYEHRVESEAAVFIAAAEAGITGVFKKVKSTIAKDLGFKGRGHYLQSALDTSLIPEYEQSGDRAQDAILAAWSELI
jgi:hypothetical protein